MTRIVSRDTIRDIYYIILYYIIYNFPGELELYHYFNSITADVAGGSDGEA